MENPKLPRMHVLYAYNKWCFFLCASLYYKSEGFFCWLNMKMDRKWKTVSNKMRKIYKGSSICTRGWTNRIYVCICVVHMCGRRITSGTLTRASAVFIPGACIPSHKKHVSLLSTAHNIRVCVLL